MMDNIEGGEPFGSQVHYVSCMKINGVPLLPPLMTQECRQEMQYYKQLALAVERRISDLKVCLEDSTLYSTNHPSDTEECFDGTNIPYDNQDRSSFSEKNTSLIDFNYTEPDNSENGKLEEFFQSNDFESLNSQVTIIDMSSENKTDNKIEKREDLTFNKSSNKIIDNVSSLNDSNKDEIILSDRNKSLFSKPLHGSEPCLTGKVILFPNDNKYSQGVKETAFNKIIDEKRDSEKLFQDERSKRMQVSKNTPTKESIKSVLGNGLSKSNAKKPLPTNSPQRSKKTAPLKKENISPITVNKKNTQKPKTISPYEPQKPRKKIITLPKHKLSPSKNITGSLNNISSGLTSPPKLVRQNSYTLESPSPLLLAHLEVQSITSGIDVGSISMSESTSTSQLYNISKDHDKRDIWTSVGSDINSKSLCDELFEVNTKKSHVDTQENKSISNTNSINTPSITKDQKIQVVTSTSSSTNTDHNEETYFQTDTGGRIGYSASESSMGKAKALSKNNTPLKDGRQDIVKNEFENKIVSNGIELLLDMKTVPAKDSPSVYFDFIMRKFQEDHERQMTALIKKQQDEQLMLRKAFENQQKVLMDQFQSNFSSANHTPKGPPTPQMIKSTNSSKTERHNSAEVSTLNSDSHQNQSHNKQGFKSRESSNSDSMEKYLTISADVLNASRSLLINRRTVNLSPTDIQCVNVMPTQPIPCLLNETNNIISDDRLANNKLKELSSGKQVYPRTDQSRNGSYDLVLETHSNTVSKISRNVSKYNDVSIDSNKSYDSYDRYNEPLETGRTNNTLDDLNFTFSSEDGAHTNQYFREGSKNDFYSNSGFESKRDYERELKINRARSKITEIQRNLASQALSRQSRSSHTDVNYFNNGEYLPENDQHVSLSSIDVVSSNYYPRNFADRNHLSLNLTEINKPSSNIQGMRSQYKTPQELERESHAASKIVAYCKGYLCRRLMRTERVENTVQTIRDTLVCALQLHRDDSGIQGADVDLHRRLIQQITAACYTLHDIFITSTPQERMSLIRQDRDRRMALSQRSTSSASPHHRQLSATTQRVIKRKMEGMSRSHSGVFTSRSIRTTHYPLHNHVMTRSHYEQSDHMRGAVNDKGRRHSGLTATSDINPRKPWR